MFGSTKPSARQVSIADRRRIEDEADTGRYQRVFVRGADAYDRRMGAMFPGTLRFRDPLEREQSRILAARLLVQIARHKREPIDPQIAADALRSLPTSRGSSSAERD